MKVTADASAIKKALDILRPGGTNRWITPVERGVKIEARGKGVLEATTTDFDHWESVRILGQQVEGTGSVLLPWAQLRKVLGIMKHDTITLTQADDAMVITSGDVSMRLAVLRDYTKKGSNVKHSAEFPASPPRPKDATPIRLHLGALAECAKFTSPDECRPVLGCVYYDAGSYVATDSYRLSLVEVPEGATDLQFLIPRAAHRAIARLGSRGFINAWVSPDPQAVGAMLWIDFGDASLVAKLQEGQFPAYRTLIDGAGRSGGLKATQQIRDAALRIYRLIKACGSGSYELNPVKIEQVGDRVVLAAKVGNNTIEIKAMGGVEVPAAFNPQYLAEFFEGTNVDTIFGADSIKPWGLEEPADYCVGAKRTRLLMPTRIHDRND